MADAKAKQGSNGYSTIRAITGRKRAAVTNDTVRKLARDESLGRAAEIALKYSKRAS